jgi:hypothetical protein
MKIDWLTKLYIKFFPKSFLKQAVLENNFDPKKIDYAGKLFSDCQRIDIQPLAGSARGFIITLDNKFSLWFFQDGDHFIYDGFETGEYDDGEVTVFDSLK